MSTALYAKAYRNITDIKGPLVFLRSVQGVRYGERITLINSLGQRKSGQVLEVSEHAIVVQVFEGSDGLDKKDTAVFFSGDVVKIGLSEAMLGRVFDGSGNPRDDLGPILPEVERPITGSPINPVCRQQPSQYIETGISTIDLMNTLVKGQKLPIFTGAGLPANRVAVQIARQVIRQSQGELIVVFAGIGITSREYNYFYKEFQDSGAIANSVLFLNLADDPTIERILTPRLALTTAEYFAFDKGRDVLVILTDMLNYANALREISSAREEIPGRRGYPGYLYTDLATNYERAGDPQRAAGLGHPTAHRHHAQRRHHPSGHRSDGLYHRGAAHLEPRARPQGDLSPDQPSAQPLAPDEPGDRQGQDAGRPSPGARSALCPLRPGQRA
jgi:V/A-type H+-transporting ATPase subunit B